MILICPLLKLYDTLVIILFVRKTTLTVDEMSITLLKANNMIKPAILTREDVLIIQED